MIVVFRVDASVQIGSGHVMRCLTLAGRVQATGGRASFICRQHPGHLMDWIAQQGYPVHGLPAPDKKTWLPTAGQPPHGHWLATTQEADAQEVARLLQPLGRIDWLVVDHYGLDRIWEVALRPFVEKIMVIDDLADRPHDCDLLLDQNLHQEMHSRYGNWLPPHCTQLLGPHYALLRAEFASARQRLPKRDGKVGRILLFFGGADPNNMTAKTVAALKQRQPLEVDVVVGQSNPHRAEIQALCAQTRHFHYHVQVENMAELMLQADLSIGAAGCTAWERCCLELPSLLLIMADNQRAIAHMLAKKGVAMLLGEAAEVTPTQIAEGVRSLQQNPNLYRQMQTGAATLCDGLGSQRVAMHLWPILAKDGSPLALRPVTLADAGQIWHWQADPNTRRYARNSGVPAYETHCQWLAERLQESRCLFHMILYHQQPAGVLRMDRLPGHNERRYEISLYLAPHRYRLGIASGALRLGRMLLPQAEFLAAILEDNRASLALFSSLGYLQQDDGNWIQFPPHT